jgi:hypothetical protein
MHVTSGKPCQDHAMSGLIKPHSCAIERAFAVVSDGCSGGRHTDVGSRLVTTSTIKALRMVLPDDTPFVRAHPEAVAEVSDVLVNTAAEHLGLNSRDLLATQLIAVVEPSGNCFVSVYGDGTVAFVDRDGGITAYTYEWAKNTPFYRHEDRRQFIALHGGNDVLALSQTSYQINPVGETTLTLETTLTVENGCKGITFINNVFDMNTALICLFTDGVMQIGRTEPNAQVERIEQIEVLRNLIAFKNLSGEFVKRRLIRFLRDCRTKGVGPLDDLGYAVIAIEQENDDVTRD